MLRKIKLYGPLAKFIGCRILEADVNTAAEAVRFLLANWPELEKHMASQHYRVSVGAYDLDKDELHFPVGGEDIAIVPVVVGAGAVGRVIAGALLITAAVLAAAGTFGASLAVGGGLYFATTAVGYIGAALLFGGLSELLFQQKENEDPRKSFSFSGIQNTSRIGTPVPIVYGEVVVGSVVVSAGIDVDRLGDIDIEDVYLGVYEYRGLGEQIEPISGNLIGTGGTGPLTYSKDGSGAGSYGTLSVSPNGTYIYTPNQTTIDALAPGDYSDVFTIRVTDGDSTATGTFTVEFTKLAPVYDRFTYFRFNGTFIRQNLSAETTSGSVVTPWFATNTYYGRVALATSPAGFWAPQESTTPWTSSGSATVVAERGSGETSQPAVEIYGLGGGFNSSYGTVFGYGDSFPDTPLGPFAKSLEGVWEFSDDQATVGETWQGYPGPTYTP